MKSVVLITRIAAQAGDADNRDVTAGTSVKRQPLLLIGGGGRCRSCIDVIEIHEIYTIAGIVSPKADGTSPVFGYPVIGEDSDLSACFATHRTRWSQWVRSRARQPASVCSNWR